MHIARGVYKVQPVRGGCMYLLEDQSGLTLVDSGLPRSWPHVRELIGSLGRQQEELHTILITHGHPDHYGGAREIGAETGARVLCHFADTLVNREGRRVVRYPLLPLFPHPPVDGLLEDGQWLPILGGLRVLHTPGHTPGSVCFYLEEQGVMFSGDMVLSNGHTFSRSRRFPGTDVEAEPGSVRRIAALDFDILCPGHGRPHTQDAALRLRLALKLDGWTTRPLWKALVDLVRED